MYKKTCIDCGAEAIYKLDKRTPRCVRCRKKRQIEQTKRWQAIVAIPVRSRDNEKIVDRARLREQFLAAYGGKCYCCGESNPAFLTVEHLKNDGYMYRPDSEKGLRTLRRAGWPTDRGIAIACFNCNCGRGTKSRCPHQVDVLYSSSVENRPR